MTREILDLRRRLREGGQLKPGDFLGDGRYLLLDRVGHGGFAVVWRARDRVTGVEVAIKVLHSELAGDEIRRERFFRGARVMAQLADDAVVRVIHPAGEDGGYFYFVMELVDGGDLRRAVLDKRLDAQATLATICSVGDALARAHAKGLVHRDIKPMNILLSATGAPKLTDFDLVGGKDTTGGTRTGGMGTFFYAAPELMTRPQEADARADVFGLGMTAIFCLHGGDLPPDAFGGQAQFIDRIRCAPAIKEVLKRAVSWERDARYRDAGALSAALREATLGDAAPEDLGLNSRGLIPPTDAATHYDLGLAYKELGLHLDAISELDLASRDPQRACVCHSMIGEIYAGLGRVDDAIDAFMRGLRSPSKSREQELALTYEIGQGYEVKGERDQALYYFHRIARVNPGYSDPRGTVAERIRRLEPPIFSKLAEKAADADAIDDDFDARLDEILRGEDPR